MPTIVNPYGYQTPIGSALGQMMDVFLKAPGPDEKALSAAKLSTLEESRRKTLLEADALRRKQKAGVDLSSLFTGLQGLATAPFVFADTNEGAVEGAQATALPRRRDEMRAALPAAAGQAASIAAGGGVDPKDVANMWRFFVGNTGMGGGEAGARSFLGAGDALDPGKAYAAEDLQPLRDQVQGNEISKIFARPVDTAAGAVTTFAPDDPRGGPVYGRDTESTAKAALVNKAAAGEDVSPIVRAMIGANSGTPRNYLSADGTRGITLDGITDSQSGQPIAGGSTVFTGQVQTGTPGDLTKSTVTALQKDAIGIQRFSTLLDQTRALAQKDPNNFGLPGFVKGKMQDMQALTEGMATGLGYTGANEAAAELRAKITSDPNLDPALFSGIFDPSLPALETASDLLVYSAAEALAGQSGRGISDRDVKIFKDIVGNPRDFLTSQQRYLAKLDIIEQIVSGRKKVIDNALGKGKGTPPISTGNTSDDDPLGLR